MRRVKRLQQNDRRLTFFIGMEIIGLGDADGFIVLVAAKYGFAVCQVDIYVKRYPPNARPPIIDRAHALSSLI